MSTNEYDAMILADEQRLQPRGSTGLGAASGEATGATLNRGAPAPQVARITTTGDVAPTEGVNEYDVLANAAVRDERSRLRQTLFTALDQDPNHYAKAKGIADKAGLPASVVARNLPRVDKAAKVNEYDTLLESAPALREAMQDRDFASVAHDDLRPLGALEEAARGVGREFVGQGRALLSGLGPRIGQGVYGTIAALFGGAKTLVDPLARNGWLPANPFVEGEQFFLDIARQQGQLAETVAGPLRPDAGIVERGMRSGFESLGTNLPPLAAAIITKQPGAALGPAFVNVAGREYQTARDAGLESSNALAYAGTQAGVEYLTERAPAFALLRDLPAGSVRQMFVNQLKTEIPGEQLATLLQDFNEWATLHPERPFADYVNARPAAAVETLIATGIGAGGATAIGTTLDVLSQRAAEQQAAQRDREAVGVLAAASERSKLRERDGAAFRAFVDQVGTQTGVTEVYVDAREFVNALNQSGIDLDKIDAPKVTERLGEALTTGGTLRVPIGELASLVGNRKVADALAPHVRTRIAAPSAAEAEQNVQLGALVQQVVERIAAEQEPARQSAKVVEQRVREQLTAANRFTPDVNEAYTTLTGAFYAATAARLGTTAEDVYSRFPLRIVAESPAGTAQLDQARRGLYDVPTRTIALLQSADLSTFLHESGHFYLEAYNDIATQDGAPVEIRQDLGRVLEWLGAGDIDTWNRMTLEERRQHHEQFARGFEAYLFEGKAPTQEMAGVFQRFRAWLVNVYRQLGALNVNLSDDVRGVFGRMLGTEDQLRAMSEARSFAPLFENPEAAGFTPEQWAEYQALGTEAADTAVANLERRSLRDMRWLSNAKGAKLRELQRDADAKRETVRAEVETELRREPVYAAETFLRRGELPDGQTMTEASKLSLPALRELYGDGPAAPWRYLSTGPHGLAATNGLHPDTVAELFGFTSGDHLVRALLAAEPFPKMAEARTDQRMLERYGDLSNPQAIERAAEAELHNEARARAMARELGALDKAVGSWPDLARAARQFAETTVARKRVRDLLTAPYIVAEARAGRASKAAFKAGDIRQAATRKREQLLNNRLVRSVETAREEVDKGLDYFRRIDTNAARKAIGPEYSEQIDQLLSRFDLRRSTTLRDIQKRKSLAKWIAAQEAQGLAPDIDERLVDEARRTSYKDITVEEFRGLVDAVRNIEHLGRLKQKLLTARDQREFDAVVADLEASIRDNARRTLPDQIESNSRADAAKAITEKMFASHRKLASFVREIDGFQDGGPLWEYFIRPMNAAGDREAALRESATVRLSALLDPLRKSGRMHAKTYIPEIGTSLSREGRLVIALNVGNETNRQRVLGGERWTPGQLQAVLDTLTQDEWNFVQGTWDFLDSYWPDIAAKQKRLTGLEPERVEPVQVATKFGTLRGGYYPIKYDPNRSTKAEADNAAEVLRQTMLGLYTRATTRRGHLQARLDEVNRPIRKDLGALFDHVNQVTHDLAWHEWLIDATRLVGAKPIETALRDHYGPEVLRQFRDTLTDIAVGDVPALNAFDAILGRLRQGATVAGLGWNLTTALLQPLGLTQSMVRIGPKWVARGLLQWAGDAKRLESTTARIYEKSTFMRLRGKTMQREISEIRNRVRGADSKLDASYFYLIQKLQLVADVPTWLGAYEKGMAQTGDETTAVALADQAVRDSQGGGQTQDLAAVQRGPAALKLWTTFYSYFNTTYNLTAESIKRTDFGSPRSVGLLAADLLLLYTVPAVLGELIREALRGGDDDDEELARKLIQAQLAQLFGVMVGAREVSSALQGFSGYSGPAGSRAFGEMAKLVTQASQGEADEAFWKTLNATSGVLLRYPAGQVQRTAEGTMALWEGDTNNPGVLLTGPPRD
ncbi:MAG: hypothetical protein AB7P99_06935 [Vicinamibacterales bacterium]